MVKPKILLLDYFETGKFSSIEIGTQTDDVETTLGKPSGRRIATGRAKLLQMDAWKFGDIEIHLSQGKVDFIWCDTISWLVDEAIHLGEVFDLDPWFLHKDVLLDEAEKCLRASHLHYRIRPIKQELGAVIKFESKTQIIFIEDEITGMRLNAFGTDLHPCSS